MKMIVAVPWKRPKQGILECDLQVVGCVAVGNVLKVSTTEFSDSFCVDVFNGAIESKSYCFETWFSSRISIRR